jgi:hypothetical protein
MSQPTHGSGSRAVKKAVLYFHAPPSRVFPLLCPERERDWITGWDYTMVYSQSGYAEPGCVFTTTLPYEGLTIWMIAEHVPDRHIMFSRVTPGFMTVHWEMDLSEPSPGETVLTVNWKVTGLSGEGNRFVDTQLDERFSGIMGMIGQSLDHYLRTGTMLPKGT